MGSLLDVGRLLYQLGNDMFEEVCRNLAGQPLPSDFITVAYFLCSKGFLTFQGVRNLCLVGCGPDALGLCASVFENLVDLQYIRAAPASRSRRFIEFEQVDKYYQALKILPRKRLPKGKRKQYNRYLKNLTLSALTLKKFPHQRGGWAKKNLRERAEAVKLGLEYDELYFIFCGLKHTLPTGAAGMVIEEAGNIDVVRGPSMKSVYQAAGHSTHYLWRLMDQFQDIFALDLLGAQLQPLVQQFIQTSEEFQTQHPELCA